ncbi:PTS sugar transporter subunit IIC [Enterococcus lactis]|uniref:PTS sugar transporter subunit IIC n=1 Tax=Enterococcus lactis TaxID=357441 RepID=UPI0035A5C17F
MNTIQERLLPALMKISSNKTLNALRNGIVIISPFTIIGSLFLIIGNLPFNGWDKIIEPYAPMLNAVVDVTFGMLGLLSVVGISYYIAKEFELNTLSNIAISVVCFLLATMTDDYAINVEAFSSTGMFTGILIVFLVTFIHKFCVNKRLMIALPGGVPPAVFESFASLIPGFMSILAVWVLRILLGVNINELVQFVFGPLVFGLNSLPGMLVYTIVALLLWGVGIHGDNVLSPISSPIFISLMAANAKAFQMGQPIPNEITGGMFTIFMCVGGTGATLGLVINMLFAKSKMYRSLGRVCALPGIFGINEPVIFGVPIVLNPIMIIPFIATPTILLTGTYFLMKFGVIGKMVVDVPWTLPPVLSHYLSTNGNVGAAIWGIISVALSVVIYYPFFKKVDLVEYEKELKEKENEDANIVVQEASQLVSK